ncbi:ABC transporter ATP-binding protein [Aminobacter carboxidus]|uniref:Spermidine/putrescine import ATP-binding protein PotA n=1 Tax=Aminobacter carboxidus TaxID=376165 RepID=A0ABR9GQV4_9HYPH|nr:ABC transporter ATP-binding protein [Aminobacter carboxidus]MBE1206068.1 ABC transporter ATP-binding protein [Aminobacter carboxidus]
MTGLAQRLPDDAGAHAPAKKVLCSFSKVNKSYDGKTRVVADLDLDIFQGEFLTLLGPSGSGKTTTLMMLAGFEQPNEGSIELDGTSIVGVPAYLRNIGMVFQNYALFPHMTVAQNLAFPLRMRGVGKVEREQRVKNILDVVRLPEVADRRPTQLSGGQQQRIALARALIFEPRLVLMDEPLGALDKQLREHMQIEIRQLHERLGITVVYVTHDQSEALTMSDRVAVFAHGKIQQIAAPNDIYERPANAFVADFIGDNNQLRGIVKGHEGHEHEVDCGGVTVRAVSEHQHQIGTEVLVAFRPENAVLDHPIPPLPNKFDVQVSEKIYLGDHLRLRCRLANGDVITVKISNKAQRGDFAPGSATSFYWSGLDCHVLSTEIAKL